MIRRYSVLDLQRQAKPHRAHVNHESADQAAVVVWARAAEKKYPPLKLLYSVPNGAYLGWSQINKLKREGMRAGVPDLCLPVARCGKHGFYCEMKHGKNTTTPDQKEFLNQLEEEDYFVVVAYSPETAIWHLEHYVKGDLHVGGK